MRQCWPELHSQRGISLPNKTNLNCAKRVFMPRPAAGPAREAIARVSVVRIAKEGADGRCAGVADRETKEADWGWARRVLSK